MLHLESEVFSVKHHSYLSSLSLFSIALIVFCCSVVSFGQNREKFVISARAGGINAITGGATVNYRDGAGWQQLMITDDLNSGDRLRTAFDGRVEILLNPGSYLRVGGNSEIELLDNTLANLEVRLLRGTAIVEATGADDLELNIGISTPHTRLAIVRQGLYRLNVVPENATELIVRKGRVILSDSHTKVKGGNKVVFSAVNVSVAKLTSQEKKNKDEVEVWSRERGQELAKANRKINDRMLNSAFSSNASSLPFLRGSFGLWFYNSRAGCYTFLPFYYGWGSPYGSSYSTAVYSPYVHGWSNGGSRSPSAGSGATGSSGSYPSSGDASSGGVRRLPPASSGGSYEGGRSGNARPEPRIVNPETGNRSPRKLERMP